MDAKTPFEVFVGPKSICKCSHLGDGIQSDHEDLINNMGHGRCKVCDCKMFIWSRFTPSFSEVMNKTEGKANENNLENDS
jgi:hypothetical protein